MSELKYYKRRRQRASLSLYTSGYMRHALDTKQFNNGLDAKVVMVIFGRPGMGEKTIKPF